MKELPILFSTPMVQAILDLLKGMTRRTRGLEKINVDPSEWYLQTLFLHATGRFTFAPRNPKKAIDFSDIIEVKCPYGKAGDLLWVRESFIEFPADHFNFRTEPDPVFEQAKTKWKPSIHMPKAAARIWLQVEEIRVERLHDISEEDMIGEGIRIPTSERNTPCFVLGHDNSAFSFLPDGCLADGATPPTQKQIRFAFWAELWCKINGRESWDSNPWVWVVKFKTLSTIGKPQMCYKTNEICKYDCKGLCRESM